MRQAWHRGNSRNAPVRAPSQCARLKGHEDAMATSTLGLARRAQTTRETVEEALGALVGRYHTDEVIAAVRHIPAREAQFRAMPGWVRAELREAYRAKGIESLYSHQAAAVELARSGKNFVVVT